MYKNRFENKSLFLFEMDFEYTIINYNIFKVTIITVPTVYIKSIYM